MAVGNSVPDIPQAPDVHHREIGDGNGLPVLGEDDNEISVGCVKGFWRWDP